MRHALSALVLVAACAHVPDAADVGAGQSVTLYFGRDSPSGIVSEEAFAGFEAEVIVPALPDGYTRFEATGHYRAPDGRLVVEPTFVINVVFARAEDAAAASARIDALRARYCERFAQSSVLRVDADARVRFTP